MAVFSGEPRYPRSSPFDPGRTFAEYPFGGSAKIHPNHAYHAVRESLRLLGLDEGRFGSRWWNPLREFVGPGDMVVLKPNFVREFRESYRDHANCLITHGSIIRAVIDYVYIALEGRGRIIIADAPQNDADFASIRRIAGLYGIRAFYRRHVGFEIEVCDLRPERARKIEGIVVGHEPLPGDPAGYVNINLGAHSAFTEINDLCHLLYGSEYDTRELHSHQHDDVHEYLLSKTILDADCVISLPKLKTHKKTGLTVNMKNLVGINGNKNWLPHHREGTPAQGGDQYADNVFKHRLERGTVAEFKRLFPLLGPLRPLLGGAAARIGKRIFGDTNRGTIRSGNWYGNDTTWRMVIDLNRILVYADAQGELGNRPRRKFFSVVDGIVAGEGNGPLDAVPKAAGVILTGDNPVAVDLACARLMGFDYRRIPLLRQALAEHPLPLVDFTYADVATRSDNAEYDGVLAELRGPLLGFKPHFGWEGHIEYREGEVEGCLVT